MSSTGEAGGLAPQRVALRAGGGGLERAAFESSCCLRGGGSGCWPVPMCLRSHQARPWARKLSGGLLPLMARALAAAPQILGIVPWALPLERAQPAGQSQFLASGGWGCYGGSKEPCRHGEPPKVSSLGHRWGVAATRAFTPGNASSLSGWSPTWEISELTASPRQQRQMSSRATSNLGARLCQVESNVHKVRGPADRLQSSRPRRFREPQSRKCRPEAWATPSLCSPRGVVSSKLQMTPCPASCAGKSSPPAPESGEGRDCPRIT